MRNGVFGPEQHRTVKHLVQLSIRKIENAALTSAASTFSGRGSGIRTHDLFNPIEARYQAAPCPDSETDYIRLPGGGQTSTGAVEFAT